jgi:hypothetical protein
VSLFRRAPKPPPDTPTISEQDVANIVAVLLERLWQGVDAKVTDFEKADANVVLGRLKAVEDQFAAQALETRRVRESVDKVAQRLEAIEALVWRVITWTQNQPGGGA